MTYKLEIQRSPRNAQWDIYAVSPDSSGVIRRWLLDDEVIKNSISLDELMEALKRAGIPPGDVFRLACDIRRSVPPPRPPHMQRRDEHLREIRARRNLERLQQIFAVLGWAVQFDPETREPRDPLRAVWR